MRITQVKLENVGHPPEYMTCWLPSEDYKLKVGTVLSLDKFPGIWKVLELYSTQEHWNINRKWSVGGL
jgi:hypothetical protein